MRGDFGDDTIHPMRWVLGGALIAVAVLAVIFLFLVLQQSTTN